MQNLRSVLGNIYKYNINKISRTIVGVKSVAKVVELIGTSDEGWEDAAQNAIKDARKTLHGITGIKITDMTAKVDEKTGKIATYRATVKIVFGLDDR